MAKVVVVGAGISGLAFAHHLQQRCPGVAIDVLERDTRPGGKIGSERHGGFLVERGPNGFLDNNPATRDLCRRLNIEHRLVAASDDAGKNRFLFLDGRLRLLPSGLFSFLASDLLSWVGKLELLCEPLRPRRRSHDEESIDQFARRRVGREVARTFADPFVTGILAGDPKLLSMQASFPRLAGYERDHGSVITGMMKARREQRAAGAGRARMFSFPGGMQELTDAAAGSLARPVHAGVEVRSLSHAGGWHVGTANGPLHADAVVLACPADAQARLLASLDPELAALVGDIPYNRIAVVALGYRREDVPHRLDGFGYLSPQRERHDVLGAQWCSSIFADRAPGGHVLIRALCGGWNRADVVGWDDERLTAAVQAEMARSVGVRAGPAFCRIVRWERAIPQYLVGHLDRVARIDARRQAHPGLFLAGNAYRGVAINDCVERGAELAEAVSSYLSRAS